MCRGVVNDKWKNVKEQLVASTASHSLTVTDTYYGIIIKCVLVGLNLMTGTREERSY